MSLAGSQTKIQLVLRNPLDTKVAPVAGTAMDKLFADQAPAPVKTKTVVVKAKAAPKVWQPLRHFRSRLSTVPSGVKQNSVLPGDSSES